jgi:CubicO group peptidase (beta-lactamase class C family)
VTTADHWHIASCTKSMTATLTGILVDAGKLRWEMSIAEALPGFPCHARWRNVTLWHLVTQRSGMGPFTRRDWLALAPSDSSLREQRVTLATSLLARSPAEPPGRFAYSNAGYGLLGAILEHATGEDYEDLLRKHIFAPLDLKTAGFGAPATPLGSDQPWGHRRGEKETLIPVDPAPTGGQFPPVLSPAGSVHMSLADFARYAWWLSTGEPRLVKAETFTKLHTPPEGSTYAGGMWSTFLPGIGGEAVCHTGHQAGFFAVFHAGRDRACVSVFNMEGGGWEWLGDEISAAALKASR